MAKIKLAFITDMHIAGTPPTGNIPQFGDRPGYRVPGYQNNSLPIFISRANDESVDLVAMTGDAINNIDGGTRPEHWKEWVGWVTGSDPSSTESLDADVAYSIGNHDVQTGAGGDYDELFDNVTGIGTILPTGWTNAWWRTDYAVTSGLPLAYTLEKNGFIIISIFFPVSDTLVVPGEDASGSISMSDWFDKQLDAAEVAGKPTIILAHVPFRSTDGSLASNESMDQAISDMEDQTIKPIVLSGHLHRDSSVVVENGVTYINGRGDVWGYAEDDYTRFSHAIIEITSPAYNDKNGSIPLVTVTGYGYQTSYTNSPALIARWKLNEETGTNGVDSIIDSSGNAHHGEPDKSVLSVTAPIDFKGIHFDVPNQSITIPTVTALDYPLTMSGWFKIDDTTAGIKRLFGLADDNEANISLGVEINNLKNIRMFTQQSGASQNFPDSTEALNDGIWHHVVAIWEASNSRSLYIDGIFNDSHDGDEPFPTTINNASIGARHDNSPDRFFAGDLDDVRIYSGVLSPSQILALYQEGLPDTIVHDEIVLETPNFLIEGSYYNPDTGNLETYSNNILQNDVTKHGNVFTNPQKYTFVGPVTVSFTSQYPLKTYPNITRARNQFIGEPRFGYQSDKAEIRYNFSGRDVHAKSTLYKRPLTLNHNTAGSDNILFNYKVFYKGKTSHTGSIYLSIDKTDDNFYSFDENG